MKKEIAERENIERQMTVRDSFDTIGLASNLTNRIRGTRRFVFLILNCAAGCSFFDCLKIFG